MDGPDTRFFAGEPPETHIYAGQPPGPVPVPSIRPGPLRRLATGIRRRLGPALLVGLFALCLWGQYRQASLLRGRDGVLWLCGPFYYLFNTSQTDDWFGYAVLGAEAACLLSVVIWPRRETTLLACFAALAWVFPGCGESLKIG
jgi:hypothetical protein